MANIKNFGIVGVGSGVQFGKGGAQLIQTSGTFAAKDAAGSAFVRFQIADGASGGDAITFNQLSNAIALVNTTTTGIQSELDATQLGAGLNPDGTYAAPDGSNYISNALSLMDGIIELDGALFTEATARSAADDALSASIANATANTGLMQAEIDQIETSVGLGTDGTLTLTAGNYLANAIDLVGAVEILDGVIGNNAADIASAEANIANNTANIALLAADVAQDTSDVANISARVDLVEANSAAQSDLITGLRTDVDANSATLATVVGEVSDLETRVTALENDDISNAVAELHQEITDETNARVAADGVLQGNIDSETSRAEAAEGGLSTDIGNETTRAQGAEADLANSIASTDSNVATLAALVAADEANSSALANTVAQNTSDIANNTGAISTLNGEVASLESNAAALAANAVLKDGSVVMTGALDLGNHQIVNLSDPTLSTDGANKNYVDSKIASLGNAFDYVGTLATAGPDVGNATNIASLVSGHNAGDYYKVTTAGYFTDGVNPPQFFNINDGLVFNTSNSFDKIDNTDSTVAGTAGQIDVAGSTDTGYTVSIDATYTAARQQEVSDEANARVAGDATNAQAVSDEANARVSGDATNAQAISDEANARVAADAALSADIANSTSAVSDEANARIAADSALASDIANTNADVLAETNRAEAAEAALGSDISNATTAVSDEANARIAADAVLAADIANTDANAVALEARVTTLENEDTDVANSIADLHQEISDETNARVAADSVLTSDLANTDANVATLASRVDADEANALALAAVVAGNSSNIATNSANIAANTSDIANNTANIAILQSSEGAVQTEVDAIEAGAGLQSDGTYVANSGATYIATAVSLFDADNMLDNAVAGLAAQLVDLSQDTIKTEDGLNSVHVAEDLITMKLDVAGNAATVATMIAGANTNTNLVMDFTKSDEVKLGAMGVDSDVDLRLAAQGAGHVIIGETGVGVIQADDGYDMTVAAGTGANLNLLGNTVIVGDATGASIAQFAGVSGATAYSTFSNGNTSVTFGAAGAASNLDLVFAPKGTGVVNMSSARVINVANATADDDAVNLSQLNAAVSAVSVGVVKTVVATLPATSGTVTLGSVTGTVLRVRVLVSNAYDANSTIVVGSSGTPNELAADTDIDEGSVGIYVIETAKDYSATTVTATVTNATGSNGAAKVIVEYLSA